MILLIWEELPERTRLFLVPEKSEYSELVFSCGNQYVNHDDSKEIEQLGDLIYGKDEEVGYTCPFQELGKDLSVVGDFITMPSIDIEFIVKSGMAM